MNIERDVFKSQKDLSTKNTVIKKQKAPKNNAEKQKVRDTRKTFSSSREKLFTEYGILITAIYVIPTEYANSIEPLYAPIKKRKENNLEKKGEIENIKIF